jgi:hypothetical protein
MKFLLLHLSRRRSGSSFPNSTVPILSPDLPLQRFVVPRRASCRRNYQHPATCFIVPTPCLVVYLVLLSLQVSLAIEICVNYRVFRQTSVKRYLYSILEGLLNNPFLYTSFWNLAVARTSRYDNTHPSSGNKRRSRHLMAPSHYRLAFSSAVLSCYIFTI